MERITKSFLWLMLTVFLFSFGPAGYLNITAVKYAALCILCGLYLAALALCALWQHRWTALSDWLWQSSPAQRLVMAYVLLSWISTLLSPYGSAAILGLSRREGAVTITIYGLLFLLVSTHGRATRSLLYGCSASVLVFCLLCFVQLAGRNPLELYPEGLSWFDAYHAYSGAYLGTIGNVDLVAAWLCLTIPLLWTGLLRLRSRGRWWLLLPLGAALAVLMRMSVLAGLIGVFGGAVLALPVVLPVSDACRRRLVLALLGGILAALAAICFIDAGSGLFHELHQVMHGHFDPDFGSGRLHIWQQVLQRIPNHLLFGAGPDTMLAAKLPPFIRYDPVLGSTLVSTLDVAHNEYLNILYHQGLPALLVYLGLLGTLARQWLRCRGDAAAAMLGTAALCYCIQAFFGFSMCMTAPFFWITLGLLDHHSRVKTEKATFPAQMSA